MANIPPPLTAVMTTDSGNVSSEWYRYFNSVQSQLAGTAGGDLSGNYPNPTVSRIQGFVVSLSGSFTTGGNLTFSGSGSFTVPVLGSGTLATLNNPEGFVNKSIGIDGFNPLSSTCYLVDQTSTRKINFSFQNLTNNTTTTYTWPTSVSGGGNIALTNGVTSGSSASAGIIGEVISSIVSSGSPVSITTSGTAQNVTSISLTAGDWDVIGQVGVIASSTMSSVIGSISKTSGTLGADSALDECVVRSNLTFTSISTESIALPMGVFNVSGSTTVYLVVNATFASTATCFGKLVARRRR